MFRLFLYEPEKIISPQRRKKRKGNHLSLENLENGLHP